MAKNQGTLVIAEIRPYDSLDTYPSARENEIMGGLHSVADTSSRDAIPDLRREEGMMCYITDSQKTYQLIGGTGNANWIELTGSSGVDELIKIDALDTSSDYLYPKITSNGSILRTILNTSSNEILSLDVDMNQITHNLLSATHPDTIAYSPPIKGDLIVGGDTSAWQSLPVGSNYTFLIADSGCVPAGLCWHHYIDLILHDFGILGGTYHTKIQGGDQGADIIYTLPTTSSTGFLKNTAGTWSWESTTTPTNHNLLSATHPDTTVGSPNRGDLITAQGSGSALWTKLTLGTTGQILYSDATDLKYGDHGNIGGLSDDDHTQYVKLTGRSGGQQIIGGTGSPDILSFKATSDTGIPTAKVLDLGKAALYPDVDKEIDLGDTTHHFHHAYVYDLKILEGGASPTLHTIFIGGDQSTNLEYILPTASPATARCFLNASLPTPGRSHTLGWVDIGTVISEVLTGTITMYGGASAPTGYLLCDGASYLKTAYADLFGVIGVSFGEPDPTHFNLPDMKIKFPKGFSSGVNLIGDTGGSAAHTPAGTNSAPAFTGDALATHQHAAITAGTPAGSVTSGQLADTFSTQNCNTNLPNTPVLKAQTIVGNIISVFTGNEMGTHQHGAITAGTPAGSVAAPTFTGTNANTEPAYLVVNFIIKT